MGDAILGCPPFLLGLEQGDAALCSPPARSSHVSDHTCLTHRGVRRGLRPRMGITESTLQGWPHSSLREPALGWVVAKDKARNNQSYRGISESGESRYFSYNRLLPHAGGTRLESWSMIPSGAQQVLTLPCFCAVRYSLSGAPLGLRDVYI
jgi:hypothetical protein